MECSVCHADNADAAKFCHNCGARLQLTCPNCGASVAPHDRFCSNCGGELLTAHAAHPSGRAAALDASSPAKNKPRSASLQSDRRIVTVLFADVVGSTALAEQMDPEEWAAIMNRAFELLSPSIPRYGGTIARLMGDALLAFFGAPVTHEDDPVRAVLAGLDLIQATRGYGEALRTASGIEFAIRVGINTGLVVTGSIGSELISEYTAMGDAVNLAARLQSAARPMSVLISQATYHFLHPFFDTVDLGKIEVKGKSQPVRIYEVVRAKVTSGTIRGLGRRASQLVGRETELDLLAQASKGLEAGSGGVVILIGEPGLGKSRLLAEWRQTLDLVWAEGQCLSYGQGLAYHLIRSLLRSLLNLAENVSDSDLRRSLQEQCSQLDETDALDAYAYLGHLLELELDRQAAGHLEGLEPGQLSDGYVRALRRLLLAKLADADLVLACEDVHWADASSVELLTKLLSLASDRRLLFCFSSRPEPDASGWQLLSAARSVAGAQVMEVLLDPLSERDSQKLAHQLLGTEALPENLQALILSKAEGNPFFVEEVVNVLLESGGIERHGNQIVGTHNLETLEVPDNLMGLLHARIDRQPEELRQILRVAAVVGRQFRLDILGYVLDLPDPGELIPKLNILETANLVQMVQVEPRVQYLFRHALVQDAVYGSLLKRDRHALHLAVAQALEALDPDRPDAAQLARHFDEAGVTEKAIHYLGRAGVQAAAAYANSEAVRYLTRALELTPETDHETRYELLLARLDVYSRQGKQDAFGAGLEDLTRIADALGDDRKRAEVALRRSKFHHHASDYATALDAARTALTLAENLNDLMLTTQAHGQISITLYLMGSYEECRGEAEIALEAAQHAHRPDWAIQALRVLGRYYSIMDDLPRARSMFERALEIAREQNKREWRGAHLEGLLNIALGEGNYVEAQAYGEDLLENARAIGDRDSESTGHFHLGRIALDLGDYATARAHLEAALEIDRATGSKRGQAYTLEDLARVECEQGMYLLARTHVTEALHFNQEAGDRPDEVYSWAVLGQVLIRLGELGQAEDAYEKALAISRELWPDEVPRTSLAGLAQVALVQGKVVAAQSYVEPIMTQLDSLSLTDIVEPGRIYLTCYRVLKAANDPRAVEVLKMGYHFLDTRAATISDPERRSSFLDNVSYHREMIAEWKAHRARNADSS